MKKLLLLTIFICLSILSFAQEQKDPEETRLREEMYKYFDTTDKMAFEDAVHQLRSYYKTNGKWHEMYTAWENEIVYDINNDHFYSALKKTEDMNDFIMSKDHQDEFYRMDYLMGMFYGTRNNIAMCKKYLDQALEKLKGRKEYRAEASNIYMLLANILAFDSPDSATVSIDKCIALCEDNRDLSAALQMKCIIEFGKKNREGFMKAYNKNSQIKRSDPKDYNPAYEDYIEQGKACFEGRFDDALEINSKMATRLDQLLFLTKIYDIQGDRAAEAEALKTLLKAREKWYGEISTMEINDISNDINLEQMRREKHDAKVAALQEEVSAMNAEVPPVVASILEGLSLGDQRVYHAIRRHGGIQAQNIAEVLPYQEGVEQPSLATVKRSIRVLTDAGLVERDGSRKTGQYVVKDVDCNDSCQVCARSPLCRQFQQVE